MANTHENNMNNVTQIVLPNQQDKLKKDVPQVNNFECFYYNLSLWFL